MMAPIFNSPLGSLGFTTKGLNFELFPYLGRCFAYLQAAITAKLASIGSLPTSNLLPLFGTKLNYFMLRL